MDEKEILISLGDRRVKEIGEVIGNKTCNKILDILAEGEATPAELAKKLKLPQNTIDYNLKKLVSSGLIEKAGHWWSVKGRRINSYKVSNKKIVITPKKSRNTVFAWVLGITGVVGFIISKFSVNNVQAYNAPMMMAKEEASFLAADTARGITIEGLGAVPQSVSLFESIAPWSWFLIGAWLAVLLFFVFTILTERRPKGLRTNKIKNLIERRRK